MDEEQVGRARLEHLLEENLELTKETNRMLRDLRRWTRIGFWTRIVLWAVIIVLPLLFIGSLIKSLVPAVGNGSTPGFNAIGLPSQEQIQQVMDLYLGGE